MKVLEHYFIGNVYCKKVSLAKGEKILSHKHKFDHMSVVVSGMVCVLSDTKVSLFHAGDIVEIKAGIEHEVTALHGDAIWLCIHAIPESELPYDEKNIDEVLIQEAA
jgi:quercetin dioxygenase-like cupin family protein